MSTCKCPQKIAFNSCVDCLQSRDALAVRHVEYSVRHDYFPPPQYWFGLQRVRTASAA